MRRHFTVTGFVSWRGHTLLHWHRKNQMWLPPGGHVEPDEDPLEAVLREVTEEARIEVTVLPTTTAFSYGVPVQLPPPATIMVEEIPETPMEPSHQHLDLIYFTRPVTAGSAGSLPNPAEAGWRWVTAAGLQANEPLAATPEAAPIAIPEDVRVLGLAAILRAAQEE